jgi:hypothetical protein
MPDPDRTGRSPFFSAIPASMIIAPVFALSATSRYLSSRTGLARRVEVAGVDLIESE